MHVTSMECDPELERTSEIEGRDSVQNSMDRFDPTGNVSTKLVHFLRWITFSSWTGRNWLNGSRPNTCFK